MRAVMRDQYGGPEVLRLREVPRPDPTAGQVLIKVQAVSLNYSDVELLTAHPAYVRMVGFGFLKPNVLCLGSDIAGTVEEVGPGVTEFQPGDEILADTFGHGLGGLAEYVVVPQDAPMVRKPAELPFDVAAAIPQSATIALQGIRDQGCVNAGQRVVINGAGGAAGTLAIQLAKSAGAEVTAVDCGEKLELLRSLGADHVVDYTRNDFTMDGQRYDFILDLAAHRSIRDHARALTDDGVYAMVGGSMASVYRTLILGAWFSRTSRRTMGLLVLKPNKTDLAHAAELVDSGALTPVIDGRYPLSEAAHAMGRLQQGRTLGKAVVTL